MTMEISLHGRHFRTLTAEEDRELREMHEWWLSQQGDEVRAAWGIDEQATTP